MTTTEPRSAAAVDRAALSDALALLGDETRLAVVLELAAAEALPDGDALSFSTLRERVGVRDSGRFNYHLDRLRDRFVDHGPDGYRLTSQGVAVAATVTGVATPLTA
jgi:hypothetical protein